MPRVLLTSTWLACNMGRILRRGFIEAGCEVVTVGPFYGRWIPWGNGMLLDPKYVYKPDIETSRGAVSFSDIADRVGQVDLIVQADPNWTIKVDRDIPNVQIASDNHVMDTPNPEQYDLIFGAHSWGKHSELPTFRWCPAAKESWAKDLGLERPIDVCMIGNMYTTRASAISVLLRNLPITVLMGIGPIEEEFNAFYNMAKIALVVSCNGDLTHRVMNNLASGSLVIMNRNVQDADKIGLKDRIHMLVFEDEVTLVSQVQQALREPEMRKVITEQAKAWVAPHSFQSRCEFILQECGLLAKGNINETVAGSVVS